MITLVDILSDAAARVGANFIYRRSYELNKDIDEIDFAVVPIINLLEVETPGFQFDSKGFIRDVYPLNIQFFTLIEKESDSQADQRREGHQEAYDLAREFLKALYVSEYFQDFPTNIQGVIINKMFDVKGTGYEINITLRPVDQIGLCLCP